MESFWNLKWFSRLLKFRKQYDIDHWFISMVCGVIDKVFLSSLYLSFYFSLFHFYFWGKNLSCVWGYGLIIVAMLLLAAVSRDWNGYSGYISFSVAILWQAKIYFQCWRGKFCSNERWSFKYYFYKIVLSNQWWFLFMLYASSLLYNSHCRDCKGSAQSIRLSCQRYKISETFTHFLLLEWIYEVSSYFTMPY